MKFAGGVFVGFLVCLVAFWPWALNRYAVVPMPYSHDVFMMPASPTWPPAITFKDPDALTVHHRGWKIQCLHIGPGLIQPNYEDAFCWKGRRPEPNETGYPRPIAFDDDKLCNGCSIDMRKVKP